MGGDASGPLEFVKPGTPTQNSYVERFNRTCRNEVLDFYLFKKLSEVRQITENWILEYNEQRPHESLGDLTPAEYLVANNPSETRTYPWTLNGDGYMRWCSSGANLHNRV